MNGYGDTHQLGLFPQEKYGETSFNANKKPPDQQKAAQRKILRQFLNSSTFHGFGRIFTSRTKCQGFFWFCLVVTGFIYVTYATYDSVMKYYSYPSQTKVRMIYETKSVFPAVTICNRNKYMRSKAEKKYPKLVDYYDKKIRSKDVNISSEEMEHIFEDIGHSVNETIMGCHWATNLCSFKNVTAVIVENYGKCFTFNSGSAGHPLLRVPVSGLYFGLRLELNLQQDEYLNAYAAGFRLLLHDQNEPPNVASLGMSLMPGASTMIGVEKTKIVNLPEPYETKCEERDIPEYKKYTKPACISDCFYQYIVRKCGCKKEGLLGPAKICSFYDRVNCVAKTQKYFRLNEVSKCSCPEPCETLLYHGQVSNDAYPSKKAAKSLEKSLRKPNMSDLEYDTYLRNNLARVEIFFKSMNYQLIQQTPAMSSIDLFGSIGGLVGLFLGGSLLTVFEFWDLIVDLCCTLRKPKGKKMSSV